MARYDRKDHFHQRAKREGVRSRAYYKLEELQRAHELLRPGDLVVDLGCWPGGWLQCAAAAIGPRGRVVGVDLAGIDPPLDQANARALVGDLEDRGLPARLREALAAPRCDVLLSDAAPKLTGIRDTDRANEERLLIKILEGPEAQVIDKRMRSRFERAKAVKTKATRKGSTERYLLGRGFRG
jgi:23S rRNA (uridine2552-2'-O)-methyltransferase